MIKNEENNVTEEWKELREDGKKEENEIKKKNEMKKSKSRKEKMNGLRKLDNKIRIKQWKQDYKEIYVALSAGAVEHADSTSAEGLNRPTPLKPLVGRGWQPVRR